jgi:hypothetical protein
MPNLTIGGAEIVGVISARVVIVHGDAKGPDAAPTAIWRLRLRLQKSDLIPNWALAGQLPDWFRSCKLEIFDRTAQIAHTWEMPLGYVESYEEVEHPSDRPDEGGFFVDLAIRGHAMAGSNHPGPVMTVTPGDLP